MKLLQFLWIAGVTAWFVFQQMDSFRAAATTSSTPTSGTVRSIHETARAGPVYATITDLTLHCNNEYSLANCRARGVPRRAIPAWGNDQSIFVLVSADSFRGDPCAMGRGFAFTGMAMPVRSRVRDRFGSDFPARAFEFHPGNTPATYWVEIVAVIVTAAAALGVYIFKAREPSLEDRALPVYVASEKPAAPVRHPQGHLFKEDRKALHAWLGLPDPIPSRFEDPSITFKLERALGLLDWATMRHSDDYASWHYRGRVQEALGQYLQALESYRIALLRNPRSDDAANALASETQAQVRNCRTHVPAAAQPA